MLHVQLVLFQLLVQLHVHHAQVAVPLVPVHQPAQLVTLDLVFQVELAPSVLLTSFQLVDQVRVLPVL